jgi:hypothetical protein
MALLARETPRRERLAVCLLGAALAAWAVASCTGAPPPPAGTADRPGAATGSQSATKGDAPGAVGGANSPALPPGSAAAGERLFDGAIRFANGGPPCLSCHDVAGLPFPHGGVLGPDLTGSWAKYGPLALAPVLNTLYFPTMVPIFTTRPLTPAERGDLTAFLQAEAGKAPATGATVELLALAVVGAAVLLVLARLAWPGRLHGVRRGLLERVGRAEGSKR